MAIAVWLTVFLLIFALGYPVAFGMFVSSVLYLMISGIDLSTVMDTMVIAYENQFVLLAVPLFIFAAKVMNAGKLTDRLFDFAKVIVGPVRGGARSCQHRFKHHLCRHVRFGNRRCGRPGNG